VKLSGKCYVERVLYRPSLDEARAYYSRASILDEILGAMRRWRVRLEPGERLKHRWFNISDRDELRETLMRLLDRMDRNRDLVKFPYMRIDGRRYEPVTSRDASDQWGLDFKLEKDGPTWRECWDPVVPVTKILDHFGVCYWLKYSGHHSLHVMLPAESFPIRLGELRQVDYMPSLYRRLVAFFDRFSFQPLNESGFHGGSVGTNMSYTLNEDTGLLNYPVLAEEIREFEPIKAHPENAEVRSFWREFPDEGRGCAVSLIEEVLRPFDEQKSGYEGVSVHPPVTLSETLAQMDSSQQRERKEAVVRLPWFSDPEATDRLLDALCDRSFKVRKAAVKALAGVDDPRCEEALKHALAESSPKTASWIQAGLKFIADINILREAQSWFQ
jgi:hypothetical protein